MQTQDKEADRKQAMEDFREFWNSMEGESKRGWTLGAHSYLDELLKRALEAKLAPCKTTKSLLDGAFAPIGSFSNRLKLARALGLVSDRTVSDLNKMTKIRNDLAHYYRMNYMDDSITDRMKTMHFTYKSHETKHNDP